MEKKPFSNLAKVVYQRTYSRNDTGTQETFAKTIERVIRGNISRAAGTLWPNEAELLEKFALERKALPAGRGLWFSGTEAHKKLGGAALNNCWYFSIDKWEYLVDIQDMLMLGGGCGASVEHRFVSQLPPVRSGVTITHSATNDADFIVPDSREGWNTLLRHVLESFFVTGRSFSFSTVCIRGANQPIKGFGGTASGPLPLIAYVETLCRILQARAGKHVRPIDVADVICAEGEMVVSGNVRRSAIILLGDPWDKEYLKAKRWDLGPVPNQRAFANWSVVADSIADLHPLFWDTYQHGEPFGLANRRNIQKYGRMGELKADTAVGLNPCAEASLESHEPCNLQELVLSNMASVEEFRLGARLMHRYGKRVTLEPYHNPKTQEVITRNRRVGTGITGCLGAPGLFNPAVLDQVYADIQGENVTYSKTLNIPESIRTTVVKPSGTLSKIADCPWAAGIHGGYSRYFIQRVRFASSDPAIPALRTAGHKIEPVIKFDGSMDPNTLVVDFYLETPEAVPVADEGHNTWRQLDVLLMAQKHWADQAVSVTVYYKKEEIPELKDWLSVNFSSLKSISFLCHADHGFKQAPWEAISADAYEEGAARVRPLDGFVAAPDSELDCEGGSCPVK